MSSILKALEKVEDAQNGRRSGGNAGLGRRRERRPAWVVPACVVAGAAVASLATFAAMGGFSASRTAATVAEVTVAAPPHVTPAPPSAPAASVAPAAASTVSAAPVVSAATAPVASPAPAVAPVAPAPAAAKAPLAKKPAALKVHAVADLKSKPQAMPLLRQPASVGRRPSVPAATAHTAPAPAPQPVAVAAAVPSAEPARQEPKVTGIAWQGSSEASFAMVNGRPLRQGGTVDGYKVERISEDSVRFSGAGGSVTVPLGAGE